MGSNPTRLTLRSRLCRFCLLGVLVLISACGSPQRDVTSRVQTPNVSPGPGRSLPSTTPTPSTELPAANVAPAPTRSPASLPAASPRPTIPSATPTATHDPFAFLTALALTPTASPEPLADPQWLQIPKIGLDVPVYSVGLTRRGEPVVLKHDVAWYNRSGKPAEGTNIVFWGHVLRFKEAPTRPAPFARLHELQPGDRITLTTAAGKRFNYVVISQVRVRPDQVEYLAPTSLERVTFISCIGNRVMVRGILTFTERLVTIAEPIQ